jgi:hypothetical protein
MPIVKEIQDRLRRSIPTSVDVPLARAVREGILLADDLFGSGTLLGNDLGKDLRGHVRRVAISYQVMSYCQRGDLPFNAKISAMPKGRWHWVEFRAAGLLAHSCRTEDVFSFPDEADSRQDFRLSLQPDLLSWPTKNKPLAEVVKEVPELYAWLTYRVDGDGGLSHLCWGSPAPDDDDWLAHINVLKEISREAATVPPIKVPNPTERLRFKDHIQQAIDQENDNKNRG